MPVMLACGRFALGVTVGVTYVAVLWAWSTGEALDRVDAALIVWQTAPFVVGALALAARRTWVTGWVAIAGIAAIALAGHMLARTSGDAFSPILVVLVGPLVALILAAAVVGLGSARMEYGTRLRGY